MKIKNAWYVRQFPQHIIIEKDEGKLYLTPLAPFRKIKEDDLHIYNGYHPSIMGNSAPEIPKYILPSYGLEK